MSNENGYEELYDDLRKGMNALVWLVVNRGEIEGIEVDCPGIDGLERTKKVMEIVGSDYRCVLLPNEGIISVKRKAV